MKFTYSQQVLILKNNQVSNQVLLTYIRKAYHYNRPQLSQQDLCLFYKRIVSDMGCQVHQPLEFPSLKWLDQWQNNVLIYGDDLYPKLWYQITNPPAVMFYKGNINLLSRPLVSIVGSRTTTTYGQTFTYQLVKALSQAGMVCVSGMAKGIDRCVHETAIQSVGKRATIGIIATGLDRVYPSVNRELQNRMMRDQLVLSEFLPQAQALKHHFIMRNRLVAGISSTTIVIEAAKKSGSLITANFALEANREVYALPGRISDLQSQGCNELIEAGAYPILSVKQVVDQILELHHLQCLS